MKKSYMLILLCILTVLVLAACQQEEPQNGPTDATSGSTATLTTGPTTPTTAPTTVPTTSPTTPTTTPTQQGIPFIYRGSSPIVSYDVDVSNCEIGFLYYLDMATYEVSPICQEQVSQATHHAGIIYFIKAAQPCKIYSTSMTDPAKHTLFYESNHATTIDHLGHLASAYESFDKWLTFVEDSKRYVCLELATGKREIMLELPYILWIYPENISSDKNKQINSWRDFDRFFVEGSLTEGGPVKQYLYTIQTGTFEETSRL